MPDQLAPAATVCGSSPPDATESRRARRTLNSLCAAVFAQFCFGCDQPAAQAPADELSQVAGVAVAASPPRVDPSKLHSDEQVLFIPSFATLEGSVWRLPIEAWVFELEDDGLVRDKVLEELREVLDVSGGEFDPARATEVLRWFMVDNERGKRVVLGHANAVAEIGVSGSNGRVSGVLEITMSDVASTRGGAPIWVEPKMLLRKGDDREFSAAVQLLTDAGVSVISDIDDTIKISVVTDKKKLLENTFGKPFVPTPGVPEAYQRWAASGAAFHYISNSPLPLLNPLTEFVKSAKLPRGSLALKPFRWRDGTFLELLAAPAHHKQAAIESTIRAFEKRSFVLVGDSGERDPEIYAAVARKFPERIRHVFIRDVEAEGSPGLPERMAAAFDALPSKTWSVFRHGSELPAKL